MRRGRRHPGADRPTDRQYPIARPQCLRSVGSTRRGRRITHRRHAIGPWLSRSSRPDRRTLRPRSVRRSAWRAHVPHRRSGALARRWCARLSRPQRRSDQIARIPYRTGRDRSRATHLHRRAGRGRVAARGQPWRAAPGRLSGRRCRATWRRHAAHAAGCATARGHAASGLCATKGIAIDHQWQAGSQGITSPGCRRAGNADLPGPGRRTGNRARRAMARAARCRTGQSWRRLLCPGRAFAVGRAVDRAHPRPPRRRNTDR